jgi:hypothetical protein
MHRAVSFLPRNKKNGGEVFLRESCVLQGIKRMEKGSGNRRKAESENISLYATLQEPEFKCFTLNS